MLPGDAFGQECRAFSCLISPRGPRCVRATSRYRVAHPRRVLFEAKSVRFAEQKRGTIMVSLEMSNEAIDDHAVRFYQRDSGR